MARRRYDRGEKRDEESAREELRESWNLAGTNVIP
jgi:hypothetical protein